MKGTTVKAELIFLAAVLLLSFGAPSAQAVFITFDEFSSSPSAQDPYTPYYDNPITEEYADWGVHFKSGPATPTALLPFFSGLPIYGGDVFTAANWPGSVFPVLPPTTQYLGLDKPAGSNPFTGIVIVLDEPSTYLGFEHRRSGQNLFTETIVNVVLFDTRYPGWEAEPLISPPDQIHVYVDPSKHGISDSDAWLPYSLNLGADSPFNLVLLVADKKFAIDNLEIYGQWDLDRDDDVDGEDLALFTDGFGFTLDEDDLAEFAAKFGN